MVLEKKLTLSKNSIWLIETLEIVKLYIQTFWIGDDIHEYTCIKERELFFFCCWKINIPRLLQGSRAEVKRLDFQRFRFPWQNSKLQLCRALSKSRFSLLIDSEVAAKYPPKIHTHSEKQNRNCRFSCKCFKCRLLIIYPVPFSFRQLEHCDMTNYITCDGKIVKKSIISQQAL